VVRAVLEGVTNELGRARPTAEKWIKADPEQLAEIRRRLGDGNGAGTGIQKH
jgi:hypothetical protein